MQARFECLKQDRSGWEPLWKDLRDYILPDMGVFTGEDVHQGGKRYQRLFDAESANCTDILAAGLLGGVSSPSRPWLRLTTMDADLDQTPEVKQWLSDVQDIMLMQLAKSEVYNALHRSYLELPRAPGVRYGLLHCAEASRESRRSDEPHDRRVLAC